MSGVREYKYWPVIGSVAVLVLSPLLEIVTGREEPYIFVLTALIIVLWAVVRLSKREVGVQWGTPKAYLVSLVCPIAVMGAACLIAWITGNIHLGDIALGEVLKDFLVMFAATAVGVIITEEGLFRGVLWGTFERAKYGPWAIIVWTSVVFALWHLPVALIEEGFELPAAIIPVYITNVFLLGLCWGILRKASGSVLVPSLSHGLWNGFAYVLFGYGTKAGALGVSEYDLYGPERGMMGVVLNVTTAVILWRWLKRRGI